MLTQPRLQAARATALLVALGLAGACRAPEQSPEDSAAEAARLAAERRLQAAASSSLLLITIDTLRADHLSMHGYPRATSPRIDRLATQGTSFEQAEVQWPKTGPSMASMLTGTYPAANGVRTLRVKVAEELVTLAEVMRGSGFQTAAFVANVNLAKSYDFHQGFDEYYQMWQGTVQSNAHARFEPNTAIAARATAWLRSRGEERFFLWVHFLDPHGPYRPPEELAGRFVDDEIHSAQSRVVPHKLVPAYQRVAGHRTLGDFIAAYDAEIVSTDAAVGEILDELGALGRADRTLVVFTSDHGESLGQHGGRHFDHGGYVYEETTRVPLTFRHPELVREGVRIAQPVGLIDLMPTIIDFLHLDPSATASQLQGSSLRPLMEGAVEDSSPVFIETRGSRQALIVDRWKLILDPTARGARRQMLFDLETDPNESRNLARQESERAQRMREQLAAVSEAAGQLGSRMSAEPVADEDLSPAELEGLRSLGYIGE